MAGSVRVGLQAVDRASSGVLVCLADHPLASAGTMEALIRRHEADSSMIIIPVFRGKRGHPTLFPLGLVREVFRGLTLRDVVSGHRDKIQYIDVQDEGVILDMDTEEDYRRIMAVLAAQSEAGG
jgi:CTP:molybdopterin cytidylyltransferase MocA